MGVGGRVQILKHRFFIQQFEFPFSTFEHKNEFFSSLSAVAARQTVICFFVVSGLEIYRMCTALLSGSVGYLSL